MMRTLDESSCHDMAASSVKLPNVNDYTGYVPVAGELTPIDEIKPDIKPEVFFEKYIKERKPVLFKGHLLDKEWKGASWTNQYLKTQANNAEVLVERRGNDKGASFGLSASKEPMKYGDFVNNVIEGNDRLYLTTQDLERFEEDLDMFDMPKAIMAEPLQSLSSDFPVCPKVFGNLVPYQISLWQGIAHEGTSSGLHHDFHDNLYILIRGKKRFRLFPPTAAPCMKTVGRVAKIHKNGLIVYRSSPRDASVPIRPDGVPYAFLAKMKREFAEAEYTEAEEELKDLLEGDSSHLTEEQKQEEIHRLEDIMNECKDRIDLAMNEILNSEIITDSDSDSECNYPYGCSQSDKSEIQEEHNGGEPRPKRCRTDSLSSHQHLEQPREHQHMIHVDYNDQNILPDNFCDIQLPTDTDDPTKVFSRWPQLQDYGVIFCEVEAGDMLYLPASWFHEVTSYSTLGEINPEDSSKDRGHLALNYWMFPPDNDQWDMPYWDDFWERRWVRLQEEEEEMKLYARLNRNGNHDLEERSTFSPPTSPADEKQEPYKMSGNDKEDLVQKSIATERPPRAESI